jgi:hypothetical protein
MAAWTNELAAEAARDAAHVASLGDDHRPLTDHWDTDLLSEIAKLGGTGIAYGNDLLQGANLPTAPVVSSNIVTALGWLCEPSLAHYCVDNVWKDLGQGADCLAYREDVVIEHCHPFVGKAPPDATHNEAMAGDYLDQQAYDAWAATRRADDVRTVAEVVRAA